MITHQSPDKLSDDEIIAAFRDYSLIRRRELKDQENMFYNAMIRFWNAINKK